MLTFFNWQSAGYAPGVAPYNRLSPNLALIRDEIGKRFGGSNLGGYGVRPIRGGEAPSTHSYGAAQDWRIDDDYTRAACIGWLIANWDELGVQAIHDYFGSRIWRANRYPGQPDSTWWRPQTPSATTGMGQAWARYLHIEVHPSRWFDVTPIAKRLETPPDSPWPVFDPAQGLWSLWPLNQSKPTLQRVDDPVEQALHDATRYLQGVLRRKAAQAIAVDGDFGPATDTAVRNLQRFFTLKVDGIVGPKTWAVIDALAAK